jgi:hypothetical protein
MFYLCVPLGMYITDLHKSCHHNQHKITTITLCSQCMIIHHNIGRKVQLLQCGKDRSQQVLNHVFHRVCVSLVCVTAVGALSCWISLNYLWKPMKKQLCMFLPLINISGPLSSAGHSVSHVHVLQQLLIYKWITVTGGYTVNSSWGAGTSSRQKLKKFHYSTLETCQMMYGINLWDVFNIKHQ